MYAPPSIDGPKSTGTAIIISLGATFGPILIGSAIAGDGAGSNRNDDAVITILLASAMIGPSAGHIYAGKFFTPGLGVRAAGLAAILVGLSSGDDDGIALVVLGSLAAVGGGIADVAALGSSVREYNLEHAKRLTPTITPVVDRTGSIRPQVGLAGRF